MQVENLPEAVKTSLDNFIEKSKTAFGDNLLSATLFGTAAEGKMRPTSDVNLILIVRNFEQQAADTISEEFRTAHAAVLLEVMFILENEIDIAAESFAVKFADIESRHKVIYGKDYFTNLEISRDALKFRLKQVLANQILRLRERYVLTSLREEQLIRTIADIAGPLRSSATAILKLNGETALSPKEALAKIVQDNFKDPKWEDVLNGITKAREGYSSHLENTKSIYFSILELAEFLLSKVNKIS